MKGCQAVHGGGVAEGQLLLEWVLPFTSNQGHLVAANFHTGMDRMCDGVTGSGQAGAAAALRSAGGVVLLL